MSDEPSRAVRRLVAERAGFRCEYCLLHEDDAYSAHQVDHIISRKQGGTSALDNLAYACLRCNVWKGSDIASFDVKTGRLTELFNPRRHRWEDHFVLRLAVIEPLTPKAEATARLLKLNLAVRVAERRLLIAMRRYPDLE